MGISNDHVAVQVAVEQERSRIANDLHDSVAQRLALALLQLEYIQRALEESPEAAQQLQLALSTVKQAYTIVNASLCELRQCIASLLPTQLEEQDFTGALHVLLNEYKDDGLHIMYHNECLECIPLHLEVPIFRLIQEAFNNIRKHAYATLATVTIRCCQDQLVVEVNDNGIGFQVEQILQTVQTEKSMLERPGAGWHVGLYLMQALVKRAGGSWEIQSQPHMGTTMKAFFPLAAIL
jgi:two-component system sensor histidine kinase DegS